MEIYIKQDDLIVMVIIMSACAIAISFLIIYCIFRRSKINIFSLRETISNLEKDILTFENNKNIISNGINSLIKDENNIKNSISDNKKILEKINNDIASKSIEYNKQEKKHRDVILGLTKEADALNLKTKTLQELERNAKEIEKKITNWEAVKDDIEISNRKLHEIQSKVDLYSQIDEFVEYGFFIKPDYIYETTERYAIEIEKVRNKQKDLIKDDSVIVGPKNEEYGSSLSFVGKILNSQKHLIIKTFNIECDFLISKVSPANFERTLKRIVNIANSLEKQMADLRYGINNEYVLSKIEECKLQYQNILLKKEEAEEQRAIREQIKEEQKAKKEYEREILTAEKDEHMFMAMLERAKKEISMATGDELKNAELRIKQLEMQLSDAIERAERAKSMAEQTKRGHVYIISNIGSFGEGVYKIGLTRRLDPTERVRELGDASVPFSFDIHAMIASDDAPSLERALHSAFDANRINAVNTRKEFFRVSLDEIRAKAKEITGGHANFIMTMKAEEYFQTKRLKKAN